MSAVLSFLYFKFSYSGAGPSSSLAPPRRGRVLVQSQTIQNVARSKFKSNRRVKQEVTPLPSSVSSRTPSVQKKEEASQRRKLKEGRFLPVLKNQNHIRIVNENKDQAEIRSTECQQQFA